MDIDQLYFLQKEKIQSLEKKLLTSNLQFQDIKDKYVQLEADFNHNLTVITARDNELEEMAQKLLQLKNLCLEKHNQVKKLEEKLSLFKEDGKAEKEDLLERLDSIRQEMRYQKKSLEDQIKSLIRENSSKDQQILSLQQEYNEIQNRINDKQEASLQIVRDQYLNELENLKKQLLEKQEEYTQLNIDSDKLIGQLQEKTAELETKLNKEKNISIDQTTAKAFQSEIATYKQKISQQQMIIDQLKKEIEEVRKDFKQYEDVTIEKIQQLCEERNNLSLKLQENEMIKKQKIKQLKEQTNRKSNELQRDYEERVRKSEYEKQLTQIDYEKLAVQEQNLRERVVEIEGRMKREQLEFEQKIQQFQRNLEQDKRQLKNDLELKEFQLKQAAEESTKLSNTISEQNKALDQVSKRLAELSSENKMLIEEVVKFRKLSLQEKSQKGKSGALNHQKSQGSVLDDRKNRSKSPKQRFLAEEAEVESYEKLFSEDEGPAIQFSKNIQQSRPMQNVSRIKYLEQENLTLKNIIDEISRDMETAKNKLLSNQQELYLTKQECLNLRERNTNFQSEILNYKEKIMDLQEKNKVIKNDTSLFDQQQEKIHQFQQQIVEDQNQIENLNKKISQFRNQIKELKNEREQLLEITNELNERIKSYEEDDKKYSEELDALHREIEILQRQIQVEKQEDQIPSREIQMNINHKNQIQQMKKKFVPQDQMPNLSEIQNQLFGNKK